MEKKNLIAWRAKIIWAQRWRAEELSYHYSTDSRHQRTGFLRRGLSGSILRHSRGTIPAKRLKYRSPPHPKYRQSSQDWSRNCQPGAHKVRYLWGSEEVDIRKKRKKAPGPDTITNLTLKHLPKKTVSAITGIIYTIFRYKYFPCRRNTSNVTVLHKPDKTRNVPQHYRLIRILSSIRKLAEQAILSRLNDSINNNQIFQDGQFGFCLGYTITLQVVRLVKQITLAFNKQFSQSQSQWTHLETIQGKRPIRSGATHSILPDR